MKLIGINQKYNMKTNHLKPTIIKFNQDSKNRIKDLCQVYQVTTSDLVKLLILENHQDQFLKKIPI